MIEAPIPTSRRRSWYQKLNFNGRVPIGHLLTWKTSLQKNNTKRLRIVPLGQGSPIPAGITPSWSTFHLYVGAHLCASELCSPWFFQFFEVEVTLSPSLLSGLVPIQYICLTWSAPVLHGSSSKRRFCQIAMLQAKANHTCFILGSTFFGSACRPSSRYLQP